MKTVKTAEELGKAIKDGEDTIEIEGDLAKKTIKLRATGKVAWAVALGAIGIAVVAAILAIPSGGLSAPEGAVGLAAATSVLGGPAALTAIAIAVAAGGVGALTKLRKYKEIRRTDNYLLLERRT